MLAAALVLMPFFADGQVGRLSGLVLAWFAARSQNHVRADSMRPQAEVRWSSGSRSATASSPTNMPR